MLHNLILKIKQNVSNTMEEIKNLINALADALQGNNALIQVHVNGECFIRKIGDVNKITDKPAVSPGQIKMSFIDWMMQQIESLTLRQSTISNHRNALLHIRSYMQDACFADITYAFICNFEKHLHDKKLSINTIAKIMKIFRRYINLAEDDGIITTNAFRKYKIKTERTTKATLSEREVKKLENATTNNAEEEMVKSTFLLAIYTGLRYSDASRTQKCKIKTIGGKKWLIMNQQKTGDTVRIPINDLFNGKAIPLIGLRAPSNSRCNIVIKRLCKRMGIKKSISMHTARRTCATILSSKGVSLPVVQHILGHSSIQTTEHYVSTLDSAISRAVRKAFR